jgi:hypothetical protein
VRASGAEYAVASLVDAAIAACTNAIAARTARLAESRQAVDPITALAARVAALGKKELRAFEKALASARASVTAE